MLNPQITGVPVVPGDAIENVSVTQSPMESPLADPSFVAVADSEYGPASSNVYKV